MELPQITYGPVQTSSQTTEKPYAAFRQMSEELAKGLQNYGMEVIRTQGQEAAVRLASDLTDLKTRLLSAPSMSADKVREGFGGESPRGVKLTEKQFDIATGQMVEVDRPEIPTWEVAGALFHHQAKKLAQQAAEGIGAEGWRSEFLWKAEEHIDAQRADLLKDELRMMHADLRNRTLASVDSAVTAGSFPLAASVVEGATVLSEGEKETLLGKIAHARESQPFVQQLVAGVTSEEERVQALKMVDDLIAGREVSSVPVREREALATGLRARVKQYDLEQKREDKDIFKEADAAARNSINDYRLRHPGQAIPFSLLPKVGTVSPEAFEHFTNLFLSSLQKEQKQESDLSVYHFLNSVAQDEPSLFKDDRIPFRGKSVSLLSFMGALSPADFKHFSDKQVALRTGNEQALNDLFITPMQEVTRLLVENGYDPKTTNVQKQKEMGHIQRVVEHELAKAIRDKNGKLQVDERDTIIRNTVARELPIVRKWWVTKGPEAVTLGVPPEMVVAFQSLARAQGGKELSADSVKRTYEVYQRFETGIATAWRSYTRQPLQAQDAANILAIIMSKQKDIDARLTSAGKLGKTDAENDPLRAGLAVGYYFRKAQ